MLRIAGDHHQKPEKNLENFSSPSDCTHVPVPEQAQKRYLQGSEIDVMDSDQIFHEIKAAADYIRSRCRLSEDGFVDFGIICGSGLKEIAEALDNRITIPLSEIPYLPFSKVDGHSNYVSFGSIGAKRGLCFQGRSHYYEGFPMWKVTMPIRIMKLLGVETVFVTNASGGINASYHAGDVMVIKDHVGFPGISGQNPLRGQNDLRWGTRFPDLSDAYDAKLRRVCRDAFLNLNLGSIYREGIYCMLSGPSYETKAEIRMLRSFGGDAVGMSTAPEVIAAKHCSMKVCALSVVTTVMDYDTYDHVTDEKNGMDDKIMNGSKNGRLVKNNTICHEDVLNVASKRGKQISDVIKYVVSNM